MLIGNSKITPLPYRTTFYTVLLSAFGLFCGCAQHTYLEPAGSSRPCVQNFTAVGSMVEGQSFKTETILSSTKSSMVLSELLRKLPQIGFIVDRSNTREGWIEALHEEIKKTNRDRAPKLSIQARQQSSNVLLTLKFDTLPGQYSAKGDVQFEFCKVIESVQVQSIEY